MYDEDIDRQQQKTVERIVPPSKVGANSDSVLVDLIVLFFFSYTCKEI